MKRLLLIIPHLSTGGLPQVVVNKVELLKSEYDIKCIEYDFLGDAFIIQRNRIINLVGHENLITLFEKKDLLLKVIEDFNPDIISFEEFPEFFMQDQITQEIYKKERKYKIFETTHDSSFNVNQKRWFPDKFIFVSAFNAFRYSKFDIPYEIVEYPIDHKKPNKEWAQDKLMFDPSYKHVVCVGLFTERKNQAYGFEMARRVEDKKVFFHFIGNQADNFRNYWEPLMKNKPKNCVIWGERDDVDVFLQASDLFFFPSKGDRNNKELNPIAIKEALVYEMPMMMYNLDVYCGKYNKNQNITYLTGNLIQDSQNLLKAVGINETINKKGMIKIFFDPNENKLVFTNTGNEVLQTTVVVKDYLSNHTIYWFDAELHPGWDYWSIPCPVDYFMNVLNCYNNWMGYQIDFYNKEKTEILFSRDIIIDEYATNYTRTVIANPFNCSYINYVEFFARKIYDEYDIEDFEIVIDAGANDGLVTEYFLDRGSKKIYCFEPDKRSVKYLKKKFIDDKRVVIIEKGLYNKNEYDVQFGSNKDASTVTAMSSIQETNQSHDDSFLAEITSYDKFISDYNIDNISLFKIDIEGAEFELLKSMTEEQKSKIKQFLVECHWLNEEKIKTLLEVFKDDYELEFRAHTSKNEFVPLNEISNHSMLTLLATNKKLVTAKKSKEPKIEIRHMLCRPQDERELKSVDSISKLESELVKYKKIVSPPYEGMPPSENCHRPNDISLEPGENKLTGGHYGCYKSHTDAILDCEPQENTIYLFFECDAVLNVDPEVFRTKVKEANNISKKYGYNFFSLGPIYETDKTYENHLSSKRLFEAHAYIIPSNRIKYVQDIIRNSKWDVFDLWVSYVFPKQRIGHFKEPLSLQAKGFSLIDKKNSEYNFLGIEKL